METALLSVTEAVKKAKAAGQSSVLILLDLSVAFKPLHLKHGYYREKAKV